MHSERKEAFLRLHIVCRDLESESTSCFRRGNPVSSPTSSSHSEKMKRVGLLSTVLDDAKCLPRFSRWCSGDQLTGWAEHWVKGWFCRLSVYIRTPCTSSIMSKQRSAGTCKPIRPFNYGGIGLQLDESWESWVVHSLISIDRFWWIRWKEGRLFFCILRAKCNMKTTYSPALESNSVNFSSLSSTLLTLTRIISTTCRVQWIMTLYIINS